MTLQRRDALLDAAIALIGERGIGAVTHRGVAARAGLPPSTTSYFFASIDELLVAAMRRVTDTALSELGQIDAALATRGIQPGAAIDQAITVLLAEPEAATIAQFETYLEAARRMELRAEVGRVLDAFEGLIMTASAAMGVPLSRSRASAFIALIDGFALQRLAGRRGPDHELALREAVVTLFDAYTTEA